MAKKSDRNVFVGLDVGTSKVTALVGEMGVNGELEILGVGHYPSKGIRKGMVVNMDATVQCLQGAIEEAEQSANAHFQQVHASISGSHIQSFNSHGVVMIKDHEVTPDDVERVTEAARAVLLPADQKILHILPQEYLIDKQEGIHNPLGMNGVRLEARVHMVATSVAAAQNLVKCIGKVGCETEDLVLSAMAASEAVLSEDEKQLGVCLIDMGGGTTDVVLFSEGTVRHTMVLPLAGDQITNDLAVALRVASQTAEQVKTQYGCANHALVKEHDMVEVLMLNERHSRKVSRKHIAEIIEPRIEEIFNLIQSALEAVGLAGIARTGMVLTGGSAKLSGMLELAEDIFHAPVRLGVPEQEEGATADLQAPEYAAAVGLLKRAYKSRVQQLQQQPERFGDKLWGRLSHWLKSF